MRKKKFKVLVTCALGVSLAASLFAIHKQAVHSGSGLISPKELARLKAKLPAGMALIPAGDCWIGSNDPDADDDVKPMRQVYVPSFAMDIHEVTNGEYIRFDPKRTFPPTAANLPATNITYEQAAAYAAWAGKRLPTEVEWEKAARGTDGRRYPWGDTWDPKRVAQRDHKGSAAANDPLAVGKVCFIGPQRVRPVGSVPSGVSVYGCEDMAGNAWEWVQGFYNGDPKVRILRGGAVGYGERANRTYIRGLESAEST